jgi:hypothetical protein
MVIQRSMEDDMRTTSVTLLSALLAASAGCGGRGTGGDADASGDPDAPGDSVPDVDPDGLPDECLEGTGGLALVTNIETIGVSVSGGSLPARALVFYRREGAGSWIRGHDLVLVDDGRLMGSLFWLDADATYEVHVVGDGIDACTAARTQVDELEFTPSATLHVDAAAAPGGDGSEGAPLRTIQEGVDAAGPGTRVLVADGVYHEQVDVPAGGSEGRWIQVIAEGGGAVVDGSEVAGGAWTPHGSVPGVWSIDIGRSSWYLARDGERMYRYNDLDGLLAGLGDDDVPIEEGFFVEPGGSVLHVRSLDDPTGHTWNVPRLDNAFTVDEDWVWIEGFEMRFFGQGEYGVGVYVRNASNVVVRNNRIHGVPAGVRVRWTGEGRCDGTRIEFNEISDPPVDAWPWDAVKGTSHEGSGISVAGTTGAIVRGNEVHHIFNGIYTGSWDDLENTAIAFDVDVYDNEVHHIGDDGFEPEGACMNNRFWRNSFDTGLSGISLAPITVGPVWILRSTFTNFRGTSFKWSLDGDGPVFVYHNTAWTRLEEQNGMDWSGPVHNVVMRNNVVSATRYAFESTLTGLTGHDYDHDNWHTTRGAPVVKWEDVRYDSLGELCDATGMECSGNGEDPGLADPEAGDFGLGASSPNVDAGVLIPGIDHDHLGSAPDLGFAELR